MRNIVSRPRPFFSFLFSLSLIIPAGAPGQTAMAEGRALWVTRFDYDSEAKIAYIMESAARAHFNIIYFQARAAGDAYYRSTIEPCAALLCGTLGGTPTYDPLEVAVREGHRRGLQVHAYLNALTGQAAGIEGACRAIAESAPGNPRHLLLEHPEWAMSDRRGHRLPCPNSEECARASQELLRILRGDTTWTASISIASATPARRGRTMHRVWPSSVAIRWRSRPNGWRTEPISSTGW